MYFHFEEHHLLSGLNFLVYSQSWLKAFFFHWEKMFSREEMIRRVHMFWFRHLKMMSLGHQKAVFKYVEELENFYFGELKAFKDTLCVISLQWLTRALIREGELWGVCWDCISLVLLITCLALLSASCNIIWLKKCALFVDLTEISRI